MGSKRPPRRPVLSIIGNGTPLTPEVEQTGRELGRRAVDAGFRIASGGLGGVMAAASRGAHESERYREGDVIGILPTYDVTTANADVDLVIPTGMGWARNLLVVATGDVVVAVGGGSGTLSEIAFAWQLQKPIIGMAVAPGWSAKLGDAVLDERPRPPIRAAHSAEQAIALAEQALAGR